jgi:hypothetical protein
MASFGSNLLEAVEDVDASAIAELATPLGEVSSGAALQWLTTFDRHHEAFSGLAPARRRVLGHTLAQLFEIMLKSAYEEDVSAKQLRVRGQTAIDTLCLLTGGGAERLGPLIEALAAPEVEGYPDLDDEEVERRARLRLQTLYAKVIRDSFTVADLRERYGTTRQRLKQLRDEDRLFGIDVPFQRGLLYPRWQFGLADGRPRAQMPKLIGAAREAHLDAIAFHMLMNNTAAGGGLSPLDLLEDGEEQAVLEILRGADQ